MCQYRIVNISFNSSIRYRIEISAVSIGVSKYRPSLVFCRVELLKKKRKKYFVCYNIIECFKYYNYLKGLAGVFFERSVTFVVAVVGYFVTAVADDELHLERTEHIPVPVEKHTGGVEIAL